jgi:hypothetical protein
LPEPIRLGWKGRSIAGLKALECEACHPLIEIQDFANAMSVAEFISTQHR